MDEFPEQPWLTDGEVLSLHARALNLLQAGQDDAGAEILLALAMARPDTAVYFRDLGLAWHRSGAWEKAWEAYTVAYDRDPQDDMTAALRAECAVQALPAAQALEVLEAVLARPLTPAAAPAAAYLARVRQLHQRLKSAQLAPSDRAAPHNAEVAHV